MTDHERALALYAKAGGRPNRQGWRLWFKSALDVPSRTLNRYAAEGYPPAYLAIFEMLERMPVKEWPKRWQIDARD